VSRPFESELRNNAHAANTGTWSGFPDPTSATAFASSNGQQQQAVAYASSSVPSFQQGATQQTAMPAYAQPMQQQLQQQVAYPQSAPQQQMPQYYPQQPQQGAVQMQQPQGALQQGQQTSMPQQGSGGSPGAHHGAQHTARDTCRRSHATCAQALACSNHAGARMQHASKCLHAACVQALACRRLMVQFSEHGYLPLLCRDPHPKAPSPTSPLQPHPSAGFNQNSILSLHNSLRAKHGAAPLAFNGQLAASAQAWADRCVFQHSGPGENLAQYFPDPLQAVQVLMASPEHEKERLSPCGYD
jgi:hypothetical protein